MAKARKRESRDFKPKRPVYDLCVLNTVTQKRNKIGAAWEIENGALRIQLELCVVLSPETLKDCILTLFRIGESSDFRRAESVGFDGSERPFSEFEAMGDFDGPPI